MRKIHWSAKLICTQLQMKLYLTTTLITFALVVVTTAADFNEESREGVEVLSAPGDGQLEWIDNADNAILR